jgi:hypothetical protein
VPGQTSLEGVIQQGARGQKSWHNLICPMTMNKPPKRLEKVWKKYGESGILKIPRLRTAAWPAITSLILQVFFCLLSLASLLMKQTFLPYQVDTQRFAVRYRGPDCHAAMLVCAFSSSHRTNSL